MQSASDTLDKYERILAKYDWHSSRPPKGYQPGAGRGAKMVVTTAELRVGAGAEGLTQQKTHKRTEEDALLDALESMEEEYQLAKKQRRQKHHNSEDLSSSTTKTASVVQAIATAAGVTDASELILPSVLLQPQSHNTGLIKNANAGNNSGGRRPVLTLADLETVNQASTVSVVKTTEGLTMRNARMEAAETAEEYVFGDERVITSNDVLRAKQLAAEKNLEQILGMGSPEEQTTWITHARALLNGGRRRRAWEMLVQGCQHTGHKGIWIWEERLSFLSADQIDARRSVLEEATRRCPGEERLWIWLLALVPPHELLDRTQQAILACPSSERLWMRLMALTPTPKDQKRLLVRAVERTPELASLFGRLARLEGAAVGRRLFQAAGKRHPSLGLAVEAAKFVEWGLQKEMQEDAARAREQRIEADKNEEEEEEKPPQQLQHQHPMIKKEPMAELEGMNAFGQPGTTASGPAAVPSLRFNVPGPAGVCERIRATNAMLEELEKIVVQAARVYLLPSDDHTGRGMSSYNSHTHVARQQQWLHHAVRVAMGEDEEGSHEAAAQRRQRAAQKSSHRDTKAQTQEPEGEEDKSPLDDPAVEDPYYSPLHGYGWTASYMFAVYLWPDLTRTPAAAAAEAAGLASRSSSSSTATATTAAGPNAAVREQMERLRSLETLLQPTSASSAHSTWLLDLLALLPYAASSTSKVGEPHGQMENGHTSTNVSSHARTALLARVPYPVQSALLGAWWVLLRQYQIERAAYMRSIAPLLLPRHTAYSHSPSSASAPAPGASWMANHSLTTNSNSSSRNSGATRTDDHVWIPTAAPTLSRDARTLIEHVVAQMPPALALSAVPSFLAELVRHTQPLQKDDAASVVGAAAVGIEYEWVSYPQLLTILLERGHGLLAHCRAGQMQYSSHNNNNNNDNNNPQDDGRWWSHAVSLIVLLLASCCGAGVDHTGSRDLLSTKESSASGPLTVVKSEPEREEEELKRTLTQSEKCGYFPYNGGATPLHDDDEGEGVHFTVVLAVTSAFFDRQAYPAAMSGLHLGYRCHADIYPRVVPHERSVETNKDSTTLRFSVTRATTAISYLVAIAETHAAMGASEAAEVVLEHATRLGVGAPVTTTSAGSTPQQTTPTTPPTASLTPPPLASLSPPAAISALPWVKLAVHRRSSRGEDIRALLDAALIRHPRSEKLWEMRLEAEIHVTRGISERIAAAAALNTQNGLAGTADDGLMMRRELERQHQVLRELCRRALQPAHCQHSVQIWILFAVRVESELLANAAAARALLVQAAKTCAGGPIELLRRKRHQPHSSSSLASSSSSSVRDPAAVVALQREELAHILLTGAKLRVEQQHSGPSAVREVVMELVQALPKVSGTGTGKTAGHHSGHSAAPLLPDPVAATSLFPNSSSLTSSLTSSWSFSSSRDPSATEICLEAGQMDMVALSRHALDEMDFVLAKLIDCSPAATRGRTASQVVGEWKCLHLPAVLLAVGKLYHQAGMVAAAAAAANPADEPSVVVKREGDMDPTRTPASPSSPPPVNSPPQLMKAARQAIKALEVSEGRCGDAMALLWELCENPAYTLVVRTLLQEHAERVGVHPALLSHLAGGEDGLGAATPPPPPSPREIQWLVWSLTAWYQLGGEGDPHGQHSTALQQRGDGGTRERKKAVSSASAAAYAYCQEHIPYPPSCPAATAVRTVKREDEGNEEEKKQEEGRRHRAQQSLANDRGDNLSSVEMFHLPYYPNSGFLWVEVSKKLDPSNVTLLGYRDSVETMLRQVRRRIDGIGMAPAS